MEGVNDMAKSRNITRVNEDDLKIQKEYMKSLI